MKTNMYAIIAGIVFCALTLSPKMHAQNAPEISIKQQLPSTVMAGSEFDVTFVINKDNLQSFARLQQTLPAGFTAKIKNGKDYHAFLNGNKAKHVWVSLPQDKEFKVTYRIKVSRKLAGEFVLGGEFDYVVNDKKEYAVVEPAKITIMPNATAALDEDEIEGNEITPVGGASAYDENIFDK
jgi:hypothetical protein